MVTKWNKAIDFASNQRVKGTNAFINYEEIDEDLRPLVHMLVPIFHFKNQQINI